MSIKVENLKGVITRLEKIPAEMAQEIDLELTSGAKDIEGRAAMLAPTDKGLLKGSIFAEVSVPLYKEITDPTFYAPYNEFGTGRNFKANGRGQIAAQFKGKAGRGSFADFVQTMLEYIPKHKGFPKGVRTKAQKLAYAKFVCLKIIKNGIKPQPFFFRAYDEILPSILSNIKKVLTK